jgi:hypothetical protein
LVGIRDGAAIVEGAREASQRARELVIADAVSHGAAVLGALEHARAGEHAEVSRYDREVDRAALGDLAHGATPGALGDAGEERDARGIGQGAEELGVEERVDGTCLCRGLAGR